MEKILLGIEATKFNMSTLDFACYIAKLADSKLTGIFLDRQLQEEVPVMKSIHGMPYVETIVVDDLPGYEEHTPAREMITESRFADLVILDAETSFGELQEKVPTKFVKEVLAEAECPVVIAPLSFDGIDEIIFTYDGSRSSVFAIKQFTYLFPELADKRVTVLQVQEDEEVSVTERDKIGELLKMHYSGIGFHLLQGKASDELFGYLLGRKNVFVVMGSFGRGPISNLFKHSTAELLLKTVNLPVFIAHQ